MVQIDEFIENVVNKAKSEMVVVNDVSDIRSDKRFYGTILFRFEAGVINPRVEKKDSLEIFRK